MGQIIVEIVRHASRHWRSVLVVDGHSGNGDALRQAVALCDYEQRRLVVAHLGLPGMDAHAGRAKTSLTLHLSPDRVRMDLAAPGTTTPVGRLWPELRESGVRAMSPNGVGDPTGASAAEGGQLFAALVDAADRAYERFRS